MNMIDIQDKLKNLSEDQLVREMQSPSGAAPQFLVLSEITRRKRMRDSLNSAEGMNQPTVAEEAVAASGVPQGGIASMAQALAPQSSIAQNTGFSAQPMMPPEPVRGMYGGGPVRKMAAGDLIVKNGRQYIEQEDGSLVDAITGSRVITPGQDISSMARGIADIPGIAGSSLGELSAGMAGQMNEDLARTGRSAVLEQMGRDAFGMRAGPDTSYQYPPMPTVDVSAMDRVGAALEGRSGFPTAMPTRDEEAIAARNDLLGGLVDRFDQQAAMETLMSAGGGRSGVATGIEPRTWGQRNIGDPLRALLQPVGDAAREVGQPIGDAAREVGQPIGDAARDIGQPIGDAARNLFNPMPVGGGRSGFPTVDLDLTLQNTDLLPPEVDPDYFVRQVQNAQPIGEAISSILPEFQVLSPDEARLEIQRMRDEDAKAAASVEPAPEDVEQQTEAPTTESKAGGAPTAPLPPGGGAADSGQAANRRDTGGGGNDDSRSGVTSALGGAGVAPMSSYEQELANAMQRAERRAEQDKWLALAQVGLGLMSSKEPTIGGALGEAGIAGLEAFRSARNTGEEERLALSKAMYDMQSSREQAAASQRAAAARASRGPSISDINSYIESLTTEATMYDDQGNEVTRRVPLNEADRALIAQLEAQRAAMIAGRAAPQI